MAFLVAVIVIILVVVALVVALAKEPGPSPTDIAIAYELAWDRLDFATLWMLSGPELRDGRPKAAFVAAKKQAYAARADLRRLAGDIGVEEAGVGSVAAKVVTRLELRDGSVVHNEVRLARRSAGWQVVGYTLQPTEATAG